MTKNELLKLSKKEIAAMCKEAELPRYRGKSELSKEEMIDNLLENCEVVSEKEAEEMNVTVEDNKEVNKVENNELKPWEMIDKTSYIDQAEVGTLIAFYDQKGKPRTAKLVNRSSKNKLVKLVTEFGWEFVVPYENVIWVRFLTRWPKGVYNILKGYKNGKETSNNKTKE